MMPRGGVDDGGGGSDCADVAEDDDVSNETLLHMTARGRESDNVKRRQSSVCKPAHGIRKRLGCNTRFYVVVGLSVPIASAVQIKAEGK
jgi:hypothetical protein